MRLNEFFSKNIIIWKLVRLIFFLVNNVILLNSLIYVVIFGEQIISWLLDFYQIQTLFILQRIWNKLYNLY